MCAFPSYAELAEAAPLEVSYQINDPFEWGLLAATFAPEPGAIGAALASLLGLAACRRARRAGERAVS